METIKRRRNTRNPVIRASAALALLTLLVAACGGSSTAGPTATATPTSTTPTSATIKVFFSKHPETDTNLTAVVPVTRTTSASTVQDQATFAMRQLIVGPTSAEASAGFFTDLTRFIAGADASDCGGADFTITPNMRGTTPETGTLTIRFCRTLFLGGIGDDARIGAELQATLLQFASVKAAVVLNKGGNCFGDLTTQNNCLKPQMGYPVVVYFSKQSDVGTAPSKVYAVNRMSPDLNVATYAISQLIAGPTATEKAQGLSTPLEGALTGTSNCSGADFTIRLDWNRTKVETGTATLQFCRDFGPPGFGDTGAIIVRTEITKTLTQFSNIKKVQITTKSGACFDDLVGCV